MSVANILETMLSNAARNAPDLARMVDNHGDVLVRAVESGNPSQYIDNLTGDAGREIRQALGNNLDAGFNTVLNNASRNLDEIQRLTSADTLAAGEIDQVVGRLGLSDEAAENLTETITTIRANAAQRAEEVARSADDIADLRSQLNGAARGADDIVRLTPEQQANEIATQLALNGNADDAIKMMRMRPERALEFARRKGHLPVSATDEVAEIRSILRESGDTQTLDSLNDAMRRHPGQPGRALRSVEGRTLSDGRSIREIRADIQGQELSRSAQARAGSQADEFASPQERYENVISSLVENGDRGQVRRLTRIADQEGVEQALHMHGRGFLDRQTVRFSDSLKNRVDDVGEALSHAAANPLTTAIRLPGNIAGGLLSAVRGFRNLGTTVGMMGVTGAGMAAVGYAGFTSLALADQHIFDNSISDYLGHEMSDVNSLIGQLAHNGLTAGGYVMEFKSHVTGAVPNFAANTSLEVLEENGVIDPNGEHAQLQESFVHASWDVAAGNGMQSFMHLTGYGILPQDAMFALGSAIEEGGSPQEQLENAVTNLGVIIEERRQTDPSYGTREYAERLMSDIENLRSQTGELAESGADTVREGIEEGAERGRGWLQSMPGMENLTDAFQMAMNPLMHMLTVFVQTVLAPWLGDQADNMRSRFDQQSEGVATNSGQDRMGMEPGASPAPDPAQPERDAPATGAPAAGTPAMAGA